MKPTGLFLSFFLFHTEYFFNLYFSTLLFNKRHLYNSVTVASPGVFPLFRHSVKLKMRKISRMKNKSKLNLCVFLNQLLINQLIGDSQR